MIVDNEVIIKTSMVRVLFICILVLSLTGCVKLALRFSPSLIPRMTQALFEECDPTLAQHSLPADLKLMEGLLKNDSKNKRLLTALCMGFTGYALLFVEDEDPERASQLYLRARDYGLRAFGLELGPLRGLKAEMNAIQKMLMGVSEAEHEALFWTTMSWNAWIALNLHKPPALVQLETAQAFLERVLELKPDYLYGAPYILMGSILAGRPRVMGGDEAKAKENFEKAMALSNRKFFLAHYYYARYYAVRVQNKELFFSLLKEVEGGPADKLREVCLINTVMKQKTIKLMTRSEDLFF